LVLDVLNVFTLATTKLCLDADDILPGLRTATTIRTAIAPLREVALAVDGARGIAAHLRLGVAILMGALEATIQSLLSDGIFLGLCATTTEVVACASTSLASIAVVVSTPPTSAIDWAVGLVAEGLRQIVRRWRILALGATILGWGDLNPLTSLDDGDGLWRLGVDAVGRAFTELCPGAHGRNRAGHWLRVAGTKLGLVNVTALCTTMLGLHSHNPMSGLRAIRTALVSALVPLGPFSLAINWAWDVVIADLMLDIAMLMGTLLTAVQSFLCHDEDALVLSTTTRTAAITRLTPIALAIDWARCLTASGGVNLAVACLALLTSTDQVLGDRECAGLGATAAAILHFTSASVAIGWNHWSQHLHIGSSALTPSAPTSLAFLWAARQMALAGVRGRVIHINLCLHVCPESGTAATTIGSVLLGDSVSAVLRPARATLHAIGSCSTI